MLGTFLDHQWKAFWRSKNKGGTIATQIFIGLVVLYLLAVAIFLGVGMEIFIEQLFPGKDVFIVFNGVILYYFAVDFLMRIQLQDLPTLSVVPYLHLKIPKKKIVNFLNTRALFSAFNLLPLFLFLPFCATAIYSVYDFFTALMYVVSILSLTVFNNYAALYIKRKSIQNLKIVPLVLLLIIALGLMEYFKVFSIAEISNQVFSWVTIYPSAGFGFTLLAISIYVLNARYLRNNLYAEELSKNEEKKTSTDYPFLDRFGEVGTLVALELKLILRNKRSRSVITMSMLFLFYGFLFYKKELLDQDRLETMLFAAIFMTGNSICVYGQFMFGWQSSHFDGLMANKINIRNFIGAKFLLFTLFSTFTTLVACLYGFISWKLLLIQFAAYLYNIGIGTVIVLYFATRNYKSMDLSKGSTFNFQGVGASQWVLGLPYFLSPYVILLPFSLSGFPYWGFVALGGSGLAAFLTREFWLSFIVNEFHKRKHKITEGFREKS
ncbi:DUF5687 family protein [Pedobacter caeni]|uniref:ABC-2 type transport system permease protein n=1 Tax=Pedobacter caeni TaxID=288992 RepID=A0A1M5D6A8_9SPHI|nr:DUF5687 family protein [Pedobacter caeni]SHF62390.1 hypothetical protein SAMN04488522_10388 [Pedobacter caeni]